MYDKPENAVLSKRANEKGLNELKIIKEKGMPAGMHIESGWADERRKERKDS
jgi:hypothetical protein